MVVWGIFYNFEKDLVVFFYFKCVGDLFDDEYIGVWLVVFYVFWSIFGDEDIMVDYSFRMIML